MTGPINIPFRGFHDGDKRSYSQQSIHINLNSIDIPQQYRYMNLIAKEQWLIPLAPSTSHSEASTVRYESMLSIGYICVIISTGPYSSMEKYHESYQALALCHICSPLLVMLVHCW